MTDEELKKAMSKIITGIIVVLVLMIIIAILIFNNFGKSTTIFKNDEQKANYENAIKNRDNENITENDIAEIESNQENTNIIVNESQSENTNTTLE